MRLAQFSIAFTLICFRLGAWAEQQPSEANKSLTVPQLTFSLSLYALQPWLEKVRTENYDPDRMAVAIYLEHLLASWEQQLSKDPSQSTRQIFEQIESRDRFLADFSSLRQKLFASPGGFYPYAKDYPALGPFLMSIQNTEELKDPAQGHLHAALYQLAPSASEHERLLAYRVSNYYQSDPKYSEMVKAIRKTVSLRPWVKFASYVRNVSIFLPGTVGETAVRGTKAAMSLAKYSYYGVRHLGRLVYRQPLQVKALGVSVAGHAAVISALNRRPPGDQPRVQENEPWGEAGNISLQTALGEVRTQLNTPGNAALSKNELAAALRGLIQSGSDWNTALALILELELQKGLGPKREPELGRRVLAGSLVDLQLTLRGLKPFEGDFLGRIVEISSRFVNGPLSFYSRDRATLLDLLLGGGGNCVSRSLIVSFLLKANRTLLPPDAVIGVRIEPFHLEPVVIHDEKTYSLVSGAIDPFDGNQSILKPVALLKLALNNLTGEDLSSAEDYLSGGPNSDLAKSLPRKFSMASLVNMLGLKRRGALDANIYQSFQHEGWERPEVPEFAASLFGGFVQGLKRENFVRGSLTVSTAQQIREFYSGERNLIEVSVRKESLTLNLVCDRIYEVPIRIFGGTVYLRSEECINFIRLSAGPPSKVADLPLSFHPKMMKYLLQLSENRRNKFIQSPLYRSCLVSLESLRFNSVKKLNACWYEAEGIRVLEEHLIGVLRHFEFSMDYRGSSLPILKTLYELRYGMARAMVLMLSQPIQKDLLESLFESSQNISSMPPVEFLGLLRKHPSLSLFVMSGLSNLPSNPWAEFFKQFDSLAPSQQLAGVQKLISVKRPSTRKVNQGAVTVEIVPFDENIDGKAALTRAQAASAPKNSRVLDLHLRDFIILSLRTESGDHLWTDAMRKSLSNGNLWDSETWELIKEKRANVLGDSYNCILGKYPICGDR